MSGLYGPTSASSLQLRGLVRGQGALNTNPGGGSPPIWWWANGSVLDVNDFGHGSSTLFELLDTNSAPTDGPMLRLVREHMGAVGAADLLHTTGISITSYSPGTSNANNETSCIFLGPTGAANGLTIYKYNGFNPPGAADYSTFASKALEIGCGDAGDAAEIATGNFGSTYQSQALTISMGGNSVAPVGVKGIVVQPGSGTFDDRAAYEVASHVLNGQNTAQKWQVTLSGKTFAIQSAVIGAGQATGAFDMAGNLGGAVLVGDTTVGVGNGGAVLFGVGDSFATRTAFAAIKGFAQDGSVNTRGDLVFSTRNAAADATMTERFRLLSSGVLQGVGTTAGATFTGNTTPGAANADGIVLGGSTVATGTTSFGTYSSVHIKVDSKSGTGVITTAIGFQVDAPNIAGSSNLAARFNGQTNFAGKISPDATATYDIGGAGAKWVNLYLSGAITVGQSATAPDPTTGGTITTAGVGVARVTPASAITGVIVQAGTNGGQTCTIVNESATNSVTMAAQATSHVSNGASCVVAANTAKRLIWDAGTSLWYPHA